MSISVLRADGVETLQTATGPKARISKRLLLTDEGTTGSDGKSVITLGDCVFRQDMPQSALLRQESGPFRLSDPARIAIDWGPFFHLTFASTSFVSVFPAQATGDPPPVTPAILSGSVEKVQTDLNIDGSDVAVSWDLDGGDGQHHRTIQNNFFGLKIIVQSMGVNGAPVPNVQFKWGLLGEMRFVGITGLDTSHFPNPITN